MTTAIDHLLADARRRRSLPPPPVRRLLRERAGLTQHEIASALGVGRPTITRYESGARAPRGVLRLAYVDLLERLAGEPELEATLQGVRPQDDETPADRRRFAETSTVAAGPASDATLTA